MGVDQEAESLEQFGRDMETARALGMNVDKFISMRQAIVKPVNITSPEEMGDEKSYAMLNTMPPNLFGG
jgi:hypothetical protein